MAREMITELEILLEKNEDGEGALPRLGTSSQVWEAAKKTQ